MSINFDLCGKVIVDVFNISERFLTIDVCGFYVKGTISLRSEQIFNRRPSLRWTQWLKITGSLSSTNDNTDLIMWGIISSH